MSDLSIVQNFKVRNSISPACDYFAQVSSKSLYWIELNFREMMFKGVDNRGCSWEDWQLQPDQITYTIEEANKSRLFVSIIDALLRLYINSISALCCRINDLCLLFLWPAYSKFNSLEIAAGVLAMAVESGGWVSIIEHTQWCWYIMIGENWSLTDVINWKKMAALPGAF